MGLITRLQPVFIILSAAAGLLLGLTTSFGEFSVGLIQPFLMILLLFVFLSVDGQKLKRAFRNIRFTLTAAGFNFIWTPLFAFGLGLLFFRDSLDLQIGLMMLMVMPCTDWYLVFTGLADGNVELGASILPLNLLLQILLLPVYLLLFFGNSLYLGAAFGFGIMMVLVIPFLVSLLLKTMGREGMLWSRGIEKMKSWGDHAQLVFLCLAIASMFASESRQVFGNPVLLLRMLAPLAVFFAANFILAWLAGRRERMSSSDITALTFTILARNSPLSLAIAVAAFPERPLISLALVIGSLIELPVLAIIVKIIKAMKNYH